MPLFSCKTKYNVFINSILYPIFLIVPSRAASERIEVSMNKTCVYHSGWSDSDKFLIFFSPWLLSDRGGVETAKN